MNDAVRTKAQIEKIRQETINILDDLSEKTSRFELPKLSIDVTKHRQKLETNAYNVLVVGEAKRGKSTFVNSLIGRDLLPTDVDIATNQVFRVSQAKRDAFRLRFENEKTRRIDEAQLLEYGSQAATDEKGKSRSELAQLRWIEVDVPSRFLPKGVNILDTPGLGSLYAAHAQITQRFIPHADAVIFVLDSNQPLGQLELEFVEAILEVTHCIFFIQTKIDLYDKEDWQKVQHRNESILHDNFKEHLTDIHVWPISSENLMKAAHADNPTGLLKVSCYKEMTEALEAFLTKAVGQGRCENALRTADYYYIASRKTLASGLAALKATSTQKLNDNQQAYEQRLQQLETEWGPESKNRRDLQSKIQKIITTNKQSLIRALVPGNKLEITMRQKIDIVKSISEADKLGNALFEEVATEATKKWQNICQQTCLQCSMQLGSLLQTTDTLMLPSEDPKLNIYIKPALDIDKGLKDKMDQAQQGFIFGGSVVILIAQMISLSAPPIALISIGVAGIWGARQLWKNTEKSQIKEAQKQLHAHLTFVLQEVRDGFLQPDLAYNEENLVNRYFDLLTNIIGERINEIVEKRLVEAQRECDRLEAHIKMDKRQRIAKIDEQREQLAEWDKLGNSIRTVVAEIKALER